MLGNSLHHFKLIRSNPTTVVIMIQNHNTQNDSVRSNIL